MERVVVEYLLDGEWFYSCDFPLSQEDKAMNYGRHLWKKGAAGIRIRKFQAVTLVEEIRSQKPAKAPPAHGPRNPPTAV